MMRSEVNEQEGDQRPCFNIDFGCCTLTSSVFIFYRQRTNASREVEPVELPNCHLIEGLGMYVTVQVLGH